MTEPIKLPPEFRSGNSIPVERATITRERMVEILTEAIETERQQKLWARPFRVNSADFPALPDCCDKGPRCGDPLCDDDGDRQARGEPVGEVFTMEPLDGSGDVKCHALLTKQLPAGTKLYAAPEPKEKS